MYQQYRLIFTAVLLCLLLLSCGQKPAGAVTETTGAETENTDSVSCVATFYAIGKADAILLQGIDQPFTMLVDTGEAENETKLSEKMTASGVTALDYLILTHFDKDHIGGVPAILEAYPVGEILMPAYCGSGEAYDALLHALSLYDGTVTVLSEDYTFSAGSVSFSVSAPEKTVYEKNQDNNSSLVITVSDGISTMLLAGDAEKIRQEELLDAGISHADFLKVPHHGVWNKGLDAFFDAVSPLYAVITCSGKNPPEEKTLSALDEIGAETYLTSDGDIVAEFRKSGLAVMQAAFENKK